MDVAWDGITRAETLLDEAANARFALADAAKDYAWSRVFELLTEDRKLVNCCRPGGRSLYTPLHQAAHGGATVEVLERLLEMGAWRTLQNARGERPLDVAKRTGHDRLVDVLEPVYKRRVPTGVLLKIQCHFHRVIKGRASELVKEHALRLPELEPLLELDQPKMWFAIPGMYGGFSYLLEQPGVQAKLLVASWCRVAEGSGQRHEITSEGSRLVEECFG
jgi:hypothetical protein